MYEELTALGLITPIFTLLGIFIGALLTFVTSWFLKSREVKLKISGQLIEKRIDAHERVLELAKSMRATVSTDKLNTEREYITYPVIFSSEQSYREWRAQFLIISNQYSHWLDQNVTKELFFIQDYVINLDKRLSIAPDGNYESIGVILKNDFIDLALCIEKAVIKFLSNGWKDLKIREIEERNKYPKKETLKRLNNLNLYKRHLELNKYLEVENFSTPKGDIKKFTKLYNIAPNGLKVNVISLKEVPNLDNSGLEYEITYNSIEGVTKSFCFGHCELTGGNIIFDKLDNEAKTLGVDFKALSLLTKWIEENLEVFDFNDQTIEYDK